MGFDKNHYTKKLTDQYQRFGKRKDSLLNDMFTLIDRGREDLRDIADTIKELEATISENEKKVEESKPVEVKK